MNKTNTFAGQIRQSPSIGGCQVSDPPLIKGSQWGGGPNSIYKGTHDRISTC